jgi:hypothetical protein
MLPALESVNSISWLRTEIYACFLLEYAMARQDRTRSQKYEEKKNLSRATIRCPPGGERSQ